MLVAAISHISALNFKFGAIGESFTHIAILPAVMMKPRQFSISIFLAAAGRGAWCADEADD